jgi:hypothetical protein
LAGVVGIDPKRMTLRELIPMVQERKRVWGELAAWAVVNMAGSENVDISAVNPYAVRQPAKQVSEEESRQNWGILKQLLTGAGNAGR